MKPRGKDNRRVNQYEDDWETRNPSKSDRKHQRKGKRHADRQQLKDAARSWTDWDDFDDFEEFEKNG